ncbi:hypothetical protein RhiirA4_467854 [Rhizophagus irregularis]|uniref:Uncharacterized protein n=1 Tax=Rhizophagus irregularis TaxID=588596 RepID=A0A2I1GWN2_9GLOM|nr:hypothetical protein RhiirA4_467854 [Rhizophagus irregularis]
MRNEGIVKSYLEDLENIFKEANLEHLLEIDNRFDIIKKVFMKFKRWFKLEEDFIKGLEYRKVLDKNYLVVMNNFDMFELHHRSFHKELLPGISIGDVNKNTSCTLGALFQNPAEPDKTFILTVNHGVGKKDETVIQPGFADNIPLRKFFPNVPIKSDIQIRNIKTEITNNNDYVYIKKVGRTTFLTQGLVKDKLEVFYPPIIKKRKKKRRSSNQRPERYALQVIGIDGKVFGAAGDSGSAVFNEKNQLWGIYIGRYEQVSFVIPIHFILEDVQQRFKGTTFALIKEQQPGEKIIEKEEKN